MSVIDRPRHLPRRLSFPAGSAAAQLPKPIVAERRNDMVFERGELGQVPEQLTGAKCPVPLLRNHFLPHLLDGNEHLETQRLHSLDLVGPEVFQRGLHRLNVRLVRGARELELLAVQDPPHPACPLHVVGRVPLFRKLHSSGRCEAKLLPKVFSCLAVSIGCRVAIGFAVVLAALCRLLWDRACVAHREGVSFCIRLALALFRALQQGFVVLLHRAAQLVPLLVGVPRRRRGCAPRPLILFPRPPPARCFCDRRRRRRRS
mmetsp:Transcript_52329/g.123652  ORF Transcript_52329/g.123652 Transcript_52329/m.123652 type:complete len:260 (+) Transcript_52329:1382-2161(+)